MAGKISLLLTSMILIAVTSYAAGWYRRQDTAIECQILHVVTESPEQNKNSRGIPVPYTVAGRELKAETFVIPGVLGKPGQTVKVYQ